MWHIHFNVFGQQYATTLPGLLSEEGSIRREFHRMYPGLRDLAMWRT